MLQFVAAPKQSAPSQLPLLAMRTWQVPASSHQRLFVHSLSLMQLVRHEVASMHVKKPVQVVAVLHMVPPVQAVPLIMPFEQLGVQVTQLAPQN